MERTNKSKIYILLALVVGASLSRFLPHPPNFTAIGAVFLFAGLSFSSFWVGTAVGVFVLLLTDLVLGFHSSQFFVYLAFISGAALMRFWNPQGLWLKAGAGALAMSTVFYLLSNLGVWWMSGMYAKTFSGLMQSYVMAIPFFGYQILGDLFYSLTLFGAAEVLNRRFIKEAGPEGL